MKISTKILKQIIESIPLDNLSMQIKSSQELSQKLQQTKNISNFPTSNITYQASLMVANRRIKAELARKI